MSETADLVAGAQEWLAAARTEMSAGRLRVAFESARHAAELAGKAILSARLGTFPKSHLVAGALARSGGLPPGVDGKTLHKLLSEFTLGTYGFDRPISEREVSDAVTVAEQMMSAAAELR
jgi:HEPN domain-containing protein